MAGKTERIGFYPGSFDPITLGHLDIIRRAAPLFDKLYLGVLVNLQKKSLFSEEERVTMIERVTKDIPNVEVISFSGLLVDCCRSYGAFTLVRGIRGVTDFDYEMQLAQGYRALDDRIDTVFLFADPSVAYVSATSARQLAEYGGDLEKFLPQELIETVRNKFKKH
ncbi:MAG: pantetheine-phosphate adenylyltransferase [Lachnospiraceae bacterium]|nr:pantetheine-phosphate adenylyltransferase [Lachnospiraceae bacterium]